MQVDRSRVPCGGSPVTWPLTSSPGQLCELRRLPCTSQVLHASLPHLRLPPNPCRACLQHGQAGVPGRRSLRFMPTIHVCLQGGTGPTSESNHGADAARPGCACGPAASQHGEDGAAVQEGGAGQQGHASWACRQGGVPRGCQAAAPLVRASDGQTGCTSPTAETLLCTPGFTGTHRSHASVCLGCSATAL